MNVFNKYESIGIILSTALMVLALGVYRFSDNKSQSQTATVSKASSEKTMEQRLYNSVSLEGELVKLISEDIRVGRGEEVKSGDSITVHYAGTLPDGTKFDSSHDRNQPFSFTLGEGKVIQGWEEGIVGMKVGGKRVLAIPSNLAYGNRIVGPIPANSTLVFVVELLSKEE